MVKKEQYRRGMPVTLHGLSQETSSLIGGVLTNPQGNFEELRKYFSSQIHKKGQQQIAGDQYRTEAGNEYKGETKEGLRHGRGVYRWQSGHIYEGEWRNGKMHGNGIYSLADGSAYRGSFANGKFHGEGEYLFANGDNYKGFFTKDRFHGQGVLVCKTKYSHSGSFENDVMHGQGIFRHNFSVIYEGGWLHGLYSGQGTKNYSNGDVYTGNWLNGYKEGKGEYRYNNGTIYRGTYHLGKKSGDDCELIHPDGMAYRGSFRNGVKQGQGFLMFADGKVYSGEFVDDHFHGTGTLHFPQDPKNPIKGAKQTSSQFSKSVQDSGFSRSERPSWPLSTSCFRYTGMWMNGKRHGKGETVFSDGTVYSGEYKEDKREGKGTLTTADGLNYEGLWKGGKKNGRGLLSKNGEQFDGIFVDDLFEGQGILKNGSSTCIGTWEKGVLNGKVKIQFSKVSMYEGFLKNGMFEGDGAFTAENGTRIEGTWSENKPHGRVRIVSPSGSVIEKDFYYGTIRNSDEPTNLPPIPEFKSALQAQVVEDAGKKPLHESTYTSHK